MSILMCGRIITVLLVFSCIFFCLSARASDEETKIHVAVEKSNDPSICEPILRMKGTDIDYRFLSCVMRMAYYSKDVKVCSAIRKIKTYERISYRYADCVGLVAARTENIGLCNMHEDKSFQMGCKYYSKRKSDIELWPLLGGGGEVHRDYKGAEQIRGEKYQKEMAEKKKKSK